MAWPTTVYLTRSQVHCMTYQGTQLMVPGTWYDVPRYISQGPRYMAWPTKVHNLWSQVHDTMYQGTSHKVPGTWHDLPQYISQDPRYIAWPTKVHTIWSQVHGMSYRGTSQKLPGTWYKVPRYISQGPRYIAWPTKVHTILSQVHGMKYQGTSHKVPGTWYATSHNISDAWYDIPMYTIRSQVWYILQDPRYMVHTITGRARCAIACVVIYNGMLHNYPRYAPRHNSICNYIVTTMFHRPLSGTSLRNQGWSWNYFKVFLLVWVIHTPPMLTYNVPHSRLTSFRNCKLSLFHLRKITCNL
jgi:hypothetical protein